MALFIYANRLNPRIDVFDEITKGQDARREYIVDSRSVQLSDISYANVLERLTAIVHGRDNGEEIKVVLAGFSPLVAVLNDAARALNLKRVFYMRDEHGFFESGYS